MQVSLLYVLALAVTARIGLVVAGVDAGTRSKRFVSGSYHFQVTYPGTWFEFPATDPGVLYIISFPPEQRVRGVFIPRGGAEIVIRPADCGGDREREWIRSIARTGEVIRTSPALVPQAQEKTSLSGTRVVSRTEVGPNVFKRQTDFCFSADHRFFEASVTYWEGDAASKRQDAVFESVLRSFRLTR